MCNHVWSTSLYPWTIMVSRRLQVAGETFNKMAPSKICGDSDVEDLLKELYKAKEVIPLYVCVKKNNDKGKMKLVNDGDGDGFTGDDVEFGCDDDVTILGVIEASQNSGRHDGSDFKVGQHFVSKDDLSYYLSIIAINGRFEMRTTKSTKSVKEVRCIVKIAHGEQASSRVIGSCVQGHFKNSKDPLNPRSLAGFMPEEMKVQVSYWKVWKGKQWAQNLIRGTAKENFSLLPPYCHMLKRANPSIVTHIELDLENKFKYFFMALGVAIRGFTYMRKVIGIDATWIKTKHKGVLLVATTQDSEYHTYPIAWGLVDSENNASWTWFLEKLKDLIPDSSDLCFIYDRHQIIKHEVRHVYVMASHGACYWHVKQNIKHRFKSDAGTKLYKKAAIAYCIEEFNKHFDQLRKIYPRVAKYLENDVKFRKWSRAHFGGNQYKVMTTNIVESVNNLM
ncbi:uncharacterized protein LOC133814432 [Humulus lupulus]|uniref:uncharacterized protein LOC133814432 n=1 Tax=Humulus lupulus TaxID=3486 RepID=UPI002B414E5F|nr:uncharacterized protein LOC133814432 [Humulus lupulus]